MIHYPGGKTAKTNHGEGDEGRISPVFYLRLHPLSPYPSGFGQKGERGVPQVNIVCTE